MTQTLSFPLFGKNIVIEFQNSEEFIIESYKDIIIREALRLQKIFNIFDKKSELSILNKKQKGKVSDELLYVLKTAIEFCRLSQSDYDISKGYNFMAFKQNTPYKEISCSYEDIKINDNNVRFEHKDVLIDLGSIAKGYIVDKLGEFIQKLGFEEFSIDARGDIKIYNNHTIVEVQDPRNSEKLHEFTIRNGAVATSGDYMQYNKDFENNHIRGKSKFSSVTIIHESLIIADILATTIMMNGETYLKNVKRQFPESKILTFDKKGEITTNEIIMQEVIRVE